MDWKNYKLGDIFNVNNSKGINANQVSFGGTYPYVTRTEKDNGISGYIDGDIAKLNPANTISFGQDTWTFFYQEAPYFTGNRVKVLSLKDRPLTKNIALFLIPYLNNLFANLSWGTSKNEVNFSERAISLPVKTKYIPDFSLMSDLIGGGIDMSKIDTSSWKEFKVSEVFGKAKLGKYHNPSDLEVDINGYPYICASNQNNGINAQMPRVNGKELALTPAKIIAWGKQCPMFAYHNEPCVTSQGMYYLDMTAYSEDVALFICSVLTHSCGNGKYSYSNCLIGSIMDETVIFLPVKETEEIDWEYMQERISELEQERISELEQERISELEQYLIATGLNDYTLTEEDKEILATKLADGGTSQSSISGNGYLKEARKFKVSDLFMIEGTKSLDAGKLKFKENGINYIGRTNANNGIQGKIDKQAFEPNGNKTITATVIGNYKYAKYQEEPYYCSQNINKLTPKFPINQLLGLYFGNIIQKFIGFYDGKQGGYKLDMLKNYSPLIPIQTDANDNPVIDPNQTYHPNGYIPDWSFMERYIRTIEKVTIADVVKYKDEVIQKTKEVVA